MGMALIAARNNGKGIVGIAPGLPLYSLKVLDQAGRGQLSDVIRAVRWAASDEGQAQNIKVINLSLAAYVNPDNDSEYETIRLAVCDAFKATNAAGVMAIAAAGNGARGIRGYLPADCPEGVMAVTAFDAETNQPASFSNFFCSREGARSRRLVTTAPGVSVLSTMSSSATSNSNDGYMTLSGTSMASPHVAGVAALCILSGAAVCAQQQASAMLRRGLLGPALNKSMADPKYGLVSADDTTAAKKYGPVVWAARFG